MAWSLSRLTEFQSFIGLDDPSSVSGDIKRPPKMDIVLLGGALGSLFSILQFVASPVIGKLSDVLGRRRVLLISMVRACVVFCFLVLSRFMSKPLKFCRILYPNFKGLLSTAVARQLDLMRRVALL